MQLLGKSNILNISTLVGEVTRRRKKLYGFFFLDLQKLLGCKIYLKNFIPQLQDKTNEKIRLMSKKM